MTDRDSTTRTRARAPGEEDYPPSTAVHWRVTDPTLSGIFVTNAMHEGRRQTNTGPLRTRGTGAVARSRRSRSPRCAVNCSQPPKLTGEAAGKKDLAPAISSIRQLS